MKKIFVNVLGTIILLGVGCILFKVGIESNGIARVILDFVMIRGALYVLAVISLLVLIDTQVRKISYWWLWFLSVFILMPIFLPLYLIRRSKL